MKNGERSWVVHDWELDITAPLVRVVVRAGTMQEALGKAFEAVFDDLGSTRSRPAARPAGSGRV